MPAPPRFLPEYDNIALAHADRSRILAGLGPDGPMPRGSSIGSLLVDGFYRASWSLQLEKGAATLEIHGFKGLPSDPRNVVDEIEAEGAGLLELLAPDLDERPVALSAR